MTSEKRGTEQRHRIVVRLWWQGATWAEVAPILDDLQEHKVIIRAEKSTVPVGGPGVPGLDLAPAVVNFVFGSLVAGLVGKAAVEIVYPLLKDKFRALYSMVSKGRPTAGMRPLELGFESPDLRAMYRFPEGLSDGQFASVLGSIAPHFATIRGTRRGVLILDFNVSTDNWDIKERESEYLTQLSEQEVELEEES